MLALKTRRYFFGDMMRDGRPPFAITASNVAAVIADGLPARGCRGSGATPEARRRQAAAMLPLRQGSSEERGPALAFLTNSDHADI